MLDDMVTKRAISRNGETRGNLQEAPKQTILKAERETLRRAGKDTLQQDRRADSPSEAQHNARHTEGT